MVKTSTQKQQSNREHHLSFWEETYGEYPKKIAVALFQLAEIHKRLNQYEYRMKVIDQNRRENAVAMGVSIKDSDEKYSFESHMKLLPEIIKAMKQQEEKFKINFAEIRPLDTTIGE